MVEEENKKRIRKQTLQITVMLALLLVGLVALITIPFMLYESEKDSEYQDDLANACRQGCIYFNLVSNTTFDEYNACMNLCEEKYLGLRPITGGRGVAE